MLRSELIQLPIKRSTVTKLRTDKDFYKNAGLYSAIITTINQYLSYPKSIKAIHTCATVEEICEKWEQANKSVKV